MDVVVSNINTATIEVIAADLVAAARGPIALSGFTADNADRVTAVLKRHGRSCQSLDTRKEWGCAVF